MVREFYYEYKESTTIEDAVMDMRGVVFRVNSWKLNEFLELPDDIESDFLDVDFMENLDLMGKTICDNGDFELGKRAFIRQNELTKISAFWHLFFVQILLSLLMLPNLIEKRSRSCML